MKPCSRSFSAALAAFALLAGLTPPSLRADPLTSIDFEGTPAGPGTLTDGDAFTTFVFGLDGNITVSAGSLAGDKLQGVVSTGGDKSGYLGGAGTDLTFTGSGGPIIAGMYPGPWNQPLTYFPGTSQAELTVSLDFSIQRVSPANQQSFSIYLYDARDAADGNTFAYHSYINIATDNRVYIQDYFYDNVSSPWVDTGVTVVAGNEYHASITVDYNTSTWSASLVNLTTPASFILATDRSTNGGAYSLSGWTDVDGGFDIQMYAGAVSEANKAFADSIYFDNLTATAIPEPSTYAALAGLGVLGLAIRRSRRDWINRRG